jgi:hypothetical protein
LELFVSGEIDGFMPVESFQGILRAAPISFGLIRRLFALDTKNYKFKGKPFLLSLLTS